MWQLSTCYAPGCLTSMSQRFDWTPCAAATARVFSMKIGVLPDRVLMSLINDRMIAKGTILDFITAFFKDYLATDSMDDLVQLLRKARLDDRLLDFFPPQKRNLTDFDAHFKASLHNVVDDKSYEHCGSLCTRC